MRILLVQPPQGDPAQPYTSLAVLAGAWRAQGLPVELRDLNVAFFNYLCRADVIRRHVAEAERRLSTGHHDRAAYQPLHQAVAIGDLLPSGTARAIGILKDKERFYDPAQYAWALRFLTRHLSAMSALYHPGRVSLQTFQTAHSHLSSRGILEGALDVASNPFLDYCDRELASDFMERGLDVLAVSVTFQTQIIPAFALANRVKRWCPGTKVVMGGAALTRVHDKLPGLPRLFRDVDAFLLFEGETAFPALMDEWEGHKDGREAPNVLLPHGEGVYVSEQRHVTDLASLPPPDHDGLSLDAYWWPEPALLYNCARGCYWGKCSFCQISPATIGKGRGSYRARPVEKIVADILHIRERTGAVSFNLAVDALPPRLLGEIADGLGAAAPDVTWDTEIRLDRGLSSAIIERMAKGGCRHVRFGFEAASQRVLDLMNKGTDIQNTRRILHDCKAAGITVSLMCQSGFPGEAPEESRLTADFLSAGRDEIAFISIVPFVLESGSVVCRDPQRFGVTVFENPDEDDLSWMHHYVGPDGRGVEENYRLFNEVDARLDASFPDRDLFFKGGLGHAHTSLYVRRYGAETFIRWNDRPQRSFPPLDERSTVRVAQGLALRREPAEGGAGQWSKFTVMSAEVPEHLATIDGRALLILSACTTPTRAGVLIDWIRYLSGGATAAAEAKDLLQDFYRIGILVGETGDTRALVA